MDDATRARLAQELNGWETGTLEVWVEDVRAILAAYDALRAERDDAREHIQTLETVMKSDATINRLQAFNTQLGNVNGHLLKRIKQLEAEHDQAAPVLAAADQWASGAHPDEDKTALFRAIVVWRAAREG